MEEFCQSAREFDVFEPLIVIQWAQIVVSSATLFVFFVVVQSVVKNKLVLHVNFQMVMVTALFVYFWHAISALAKQLYHRFGQDECHGVLVRWKCMLSSAPILITIIGFCVCHVTVFVERVCATLFLHSYERKSRKYGFGLVLACVSVIGCWSLYIFRNDDVFSYSDYCMGTTEESHPRVFYSFYVMLFLDVSVTAGDMFLYLLSKQRLRQRSSAAFSKHNEKLYQLSRSYQLRENKLTTSLVFPLSAVHSICFIFYLVVSTLFRNIYDMNDDKMSSITSIEAASTILGFYELATLLMLLTLHKRLYKRQQSRVHFVDPENAGDVYFKLFSDQIKD